MTKRAHVEDFIARSRARYAYAGDIADIVRTYADPWTCTWVLTTDAYGSRCRGHKYLYVHCSSFGKGSFLYREEQTKEVTYFTGPRQDADTKGYLWRMTRLSSDGSLRFHRLESPFDLRGSRRTDPWVERPEFTIREPYMMYPGETARGITVVGDPFMVIYQTADPARSEADAVMAGVVHEWYLWTGDAWVHSGDGSGVSYPNTWAHEVGGNNEYAVHCKEVTAGSAGKPMEMRVVGLVDGKLLLVNRDRHAPKFRLLSALTRRNLAGGGEPFEMPFQMACDCEVVRRAGRFEFI